MIKKFCVLALIGLFLSGCGAAARKSEFWQHDRMYASWDHLKFSWFGHKKSTAETAKKSQEQGWWGVDIPYIPAR